VSIGGIPATLLQPLDRQEFTIFTHNERVAHLSAPGHLDGEAPVAGRGDDQPAVRVRSIRLRMAPGAERDQAVEVDEPLWARLSNVRPRRPLPPHPPGTRSD
jgi:hypothetical protein